MTTAPRFVGFSRNPSGQFRNRRWSAGTPAATRDRRRWPNRRFNRGVSGIRRRNSPSILGIDLISRMYRTRNYADGGPREIPRGAARVIRPFELGIVRSRFDKYLVYTYTLAISIMIIITVHAHTHT